MALAHLPASTCESPYSEEARKAKYSGVVLVEAVITVMDSERIPG